MSRVHSIDEYPIPFDRDEIMEMQEEAMEGEMPLITNEEYIEETVDGFHEKYINEMVRTSEWSVFECYWGRCCQYLYFWNYQGEYGFRVDHDWEVLCPFADMIEAFADEYDSSDFEPNMYPWQLP